MEGFFSRAHYWVTPCNAAITRSSIGLVVAAGYAGDFQSPPILTTLAACAANASEIEHFPHNRLVEREEMREWPGTDSVEEPFWGFGFPAPLCIIQLWVLSARSSDFKRSTFQPFRKAVTRQQSMSPSGSTLPGLG